MRRGRRFGAGLAVSRGDGAAGGADGSMPATAVVRGGRWRDFMVVETASSAAAATAKRRDNGDTDDGNEASKTMASQPQQATALRQKQKHPRQSRSVTWKEDREEESKDKGKALPPQTQTLHAALRQRRSVEWQTAAATAATAEAEDKEGRQGESTMAPSALPKETRALHAALTQRRSVEWQPVKAVAMFDGDDGQESEDTKADSQAAPAEHKAEAAGQAEQAVQALPSETRALRSALTQRRSVEWKGVRDEAELFTGK